MRCKTSLSITCLVAFTLISGPVQALVTSATTPTSTITQLTDYASTRGTHASTAPDISKDGSTIVFNSTADLVPGGNPNNLENIYIMKSDGSGLRQLTAAIAPTSPVEHTAYYRTTTPPRLSANGKVVVFASYFDLTGKNPPEYISDPLHYLPNYQLFIINSDGTNLRQLTRGTGGHSISPRISNDGSTIVFESTHDLVVGSNSLVNTRGNHVKQIFVIRANGTGLTQITNGGPQPTGRNIRDDESRNVSISGDGTTVAFDSFNDLLPPKNDDWSNEIFVFDLAKYWSDRATNIINGLTHYTVQVTDTDVDAPFHIRAEDAFEPSLSYDGKKVTFSGCINPYGEGIKNPDRTILGDNPFLTDVIFVANSDGSGLLRQLTFSDDPNAYTGTNWRNIDDDAHWPEISADGSKIVFGSRSRADLAAPKPGSPRLYEIAMIDLKAPLDRNGRPVVEQITSSPRLGVMQLTFGGTDGARLRPSINADASLITLRTTSDFTGGNVDKNSEIFLIKPLVADKTTTDDDTTTAATNDNATTSVTTQQNSDSTTTETSAVNNQGSASKASSTTTGGGAFGLIELLFSMGALGSLILRRRSA